MREMMFLAKHGVPPSEQRQWSRVRRLAAVAACVELDGMTFDWTTMRAIPKAS